MPIARWSARLACLGALVLAAPRPAPAAQDPIVARAVQWLRGQNGGQTGEVALAALAMVKAEVPLDDPALVKAIGIVDRRFTGASYRPEGSSGAEIYEAGITILMYAAIDPARYRPQIEAVARFLGTKQNPNGSWDYIGRTTGDTSISQYAVLGMWEAENSGIPISPALWDRAAGYFLGSQRPNGSWTYHPGESNDETISMTAAGVGSLLICSRQLEPARKAVRLANPLLVPLVSEAERAKYTVATSQSRLDGAIRGGLGWIAANFNTSAEAILGHSPYYALYGVERAGSLSGIAVLGRSNWFVEGRKFMEKAQAAAGNFDSQYGSIPNTAWAVLFLAKATEKTLRKIQIRRLGAGTLVGGRGLPSDLSQLAVAGGHVIARPMDGAVDGMLAVLEDPRVDDASSAFSGLMARYRTEGSKVLRPYTDRFRHMLTDPDQGVRRVAAWSLARAGDLAMAPPLIDALADPDDGVVAEAAAGLSLLSRKIDGYGPGRGSDAAGKAEAAAKWRAWYESVRPIDSGAGPQPGRAGR